MNNIHLLDLWKESFRTIEPKTLASRLRKTEKARGPALFWGKAAYGFYREWVRAGDEGPFFGISPHPSPDPGSPRLRWIQAEHPLPGSGSFRAGLELLEFFEGLRTEDARRLDVFLSGGASSLAWLPWRDQSEEEIRERLEELYRRPLSIRDLNRERAKLCQLKNGGTAGWLGLLAPEVRAHVFVLSDVLPYGPEVVGSGPFWSRGIRHTVLADNSTIVGSLARGATRAGAKVLHSSSGNVDSVQAWVRKLSTLIENATRRAESGVIILGGEPKIRLPRAGAGKGGRQTHLALALAREWTREIVAGKVEILAMSTDGCDGDSAAAGAYLTAKTFSRGAGANLSRALARFDSASVLSRAGALVSALEAPERVSNAQDVLLIQVVA